MVAVVELLAASTEPLGAADIARRLGLNLSTCTAVLASLVNAGWVARDDERRHRPGAALLPVLDGVRRRLPLDEMTALHDELGYGLTLTRIEDDGLVVIAATGPLPDGVRAGARFPLTPPYGLVARAWSTKDEFEAWLDEATIPLDRRQRSVLRRAAADLRARGWVAWRLHPATRAAVAALQSALTATADEAVRRELVRLGALLGQSAITAAELRGSSPVPVGHVLAAVGEGHPGHQLELHVLEPAVRPAAARAMGERLRALARSLRL